MSAAWPHLADGAARGAGGERRISLQRRRDLALALCRLPGLVAARVHGGTPAHQLMLRDREVDGAVGNIDDDMVAILDQSDQPAFCRFRRYMADRQARGAAGEAAVGDQGAGLAETLCLQIAGWIE